MKQKATHNRSNTKGNLFFSLEKTITKSSGINFLYVKDNHLGNVLATVSDIRLADNGTDIGNNGTVDFYTADVKSTNLFYPFGSTFDIPRGINDPTSEGYRYGFNGMEKDDEVKGNGNSYTTEYRILDPRIGRWLSMDPVRKGYESPYVGFSDNPIYYKDPQGDTGEEPTKKTGTDAGHGDKPKGKKWTDPGACDNCGSNDPVSSQEKESDYALLIEAAVDKALTSFGVDNTRTRTEKEITPDGTKVQWRYDKINDAGVDVFVSIHLNNGADNQFMAFFEGGIGNEAESKKLGKAILTAVNGLTGFTVDTDPLNATNTSVKSLGVLREFKGEAGILLEVGGIDSKENRINIKTNAENIGKQIAIGMYKYIYGTEPVVNTGGVNNTVVTPPAVPVQINPAAADATKVAPVWIIPH
jgi:RHS repeat-associated protein